MFPRRLSKVRPPRAGRRCGLRQDSPCSTRLERENAGSQQARGIFLRDDCAILFTIVQACRHRGINPFDYLKDVLTQIPRHTNKTVAQLTPDTGSKSASLT